MMGGWGFVQAAYAVAYGSLGLYAIGLIGRARRLLAAASAAAAAPGGSPQGSGRPEETL